MPSDIEVVVTQSKALEALLEQKFAATGRGLHEKLTSVEYQFETALVKNLRWIATMRNKVVHEDFQLSDQNEFLRSCERALEGLKNTQHSLRVVDKPNANQYESNRNRFQPGNSRTVRTPHIVNNRRSTGPRSIRQPRQQQKSNSGLIFIIFVVVVAIIWSFISK